MTGLADTRLLIADDLLRLSYQGVRGELVRGVLHETMASGHRHGKIAVNLVTELNNFVKPRKRGCRRSPAQYPLAQHGHEPVYGPQSPLQNPPHGQRLIRRRR